MASQSPSLSGVLADPVALTRALVDIESVSGDEKEITDAVELALQSAPHLSVQRVGNVVRASTNLGRPQRVILATPDTVPVHDNLPSRLDGDLLYGCGTDMKSGSALALHLAVSEAEPVFDVTYLFYDCEEIDAERNGLNKISQSHPSWLQADFVILLEPTHGRVEGCCQGTIRDRMGRGSAAPTRPGRGFGVTRSTVLPPYPAAADYESRRVTIDGVGIRGRPTAVGTEAVPAMCPRPCEIDVNHRFAPDRNPAEAEAHLRSLFAGYPVEIVDAVAGAPPGLSSAPAQDFIAAVGSVPIGKLGWTDVALFASLGVPALNFGPGDPNLAPPRHTLARGPRRSRRPPSLAHRSILVSSSTRLPRPRSLR
jgi:succinyl-diaminopimelate desuccinylase